MLAIDDHPELYKSVAVTLALQGFQMLQAHDSLEAIVTSASRDAKLDRLLTEMDMARINGEGFAECPRRAIGGTENYDTSQHAHSDY